VPDGRYHMVALIPAATDFSLAKAVDYFQQRARPKPTKVEMAEGEPGFRVCYGAWGIEATYEAGPVVRETNEALSEDPPRGAPASAEVIASCDRQLDLWSDPDPDLKYTNHWIIFTEELKDAFPGVILFDWDQGKWWDEAPG